MLTNPVIYGVDGSFPIRPLLEAIRNGRTDAAEITEGFAAAQTASETTCSFPSGLLTLTGSCTSVYSGSTATRWWLDEQPFRVGGADYFDAKALAVAASRRPPRVAGA